MMFYTLFNMFLLNLVLDICLISEYISADNYPLDNDTKPCSQIKNTINYIGPICIPGANDDGWTPESVENCRGPFKTECPEFNEAECMWYDYLPSDPAQKEKLANVPLQLPCCRLKYFAAGGSLTKYTWMEVYFTNQYGTWDSDKTVFDIVEIHRLIKNHDAFSNFDQNDWPDSVLDGNGERGLTWKDLNGPLTLKLDDICGKGDPAPAYKAIVEFLSANHKDGFDSKKVPPKSDTENNSNATITYEYDPKCSVALFAGSKVNVCRVTYFRRVTYGYSHTSGRSQTSGTHNRTTKFLEAQIFNDKASKAPRLRYAYLNYVTEN